MKAERRALPLIDGCEVELRAGKEFTGLASVYYDGTAKTEYALGENMVERVHKGAFDRVLAAGQDCFALYHHREDMMLGRRSSGTLMLEDERRGLAYRVPYDDSDPIHQTVAARIRRKDVRGSSVTWKVNEQTFERRSDGKIVRNIHSVELMLDVGPTHIPCYASTSAEMRSELSREQVADLERLAAGQLIEPPTPIEFWGIS